MSGNTLSAADRVNALVTARAEIGLPDFSDDELEVLLIKEMEVDKPEPKKRKRKKLWLEWIPYDIASVLIVLFGVFLHVMYFPSVSAGENNIFMWLIVPLILLIPAAAFGFTASEKRNPANGKAWSFLLMAIVFTVYSAVLDTYVTRAILKNQLNDMPEMGECIIYGVLGDSVDVRGADGGLFNLDYRREDIGGVEEIYLQRDGGPPMPAATVLKEIC